MFVLVQVVIPAFSLRDWKGRTWKTSVSVAASPIEILKRYLGIQVHNFTWLGPAHIEGHKS